MRILVVAIGYRDYGPHYADALRAAGHEVELYVGLRQGHLPTRVARLVTVTIPSKLGAERDDLLREQHLLAAYLRRRVGSYDLALFVNAHQLATDETLQELAERGIPSGLWLLDDLDTLRTDRLSLESFEHLASFSRVDAERIPGCGYVPQGLAFVPPPLVDRRPAHRPLVLGAPYPRRRDVALALSNSGIEIDVVGQTWTSFDMPPGVVVHGDVTLARSMQVSADARVCVNAHRRVDTGLSPRVFEIAGMGGLPVTDNVFARDFLEPGREMLHWTEPGEAVEHVERAIREPAWSREISSRARRRTLAEHALHRRFSTLLRGWGLAG